MPATRRFTALNGTALLLGVLAGLAAVFFRWAISLVENVAFRGKVAASAKESAEFIQSPWGMLVFLVPAAGGLIVGLTRLLFPEIRRQGIAEVMAAVQARGGLIRTRTAWGHAFLSAMTVGTGGSTGREGPIGYIGGAIGSSLGRHLGLKQRDVKILVGAGVAAGIAATFNAPLGGVLFAMELILPEFSTHAFIPVVAATVIGVTVGHAFLGDTPAFMVPQFTLESPWELGIYMILGLLCGLGGVGFIRTMARATDMGERVRLPVWATPVLGGLLVGILGLVIFEVTRFTFFGGTSQYHIFGTGYASVSALLDPEGKGFMLAVPLLVLLIIAKPLASSITIGSGGGGGVFSASLYQGALYGALVGLVANHFLPDLTAPVSAYVLVGMGAFYASTGRATLTTIVLLMELTNSRAIILPLMLAAVTADAVSVGLSHDSIYTVRLTKRGIHYEHDRTLSPLDTTLVEDVMSREVDTLPDTLTVGEAFNQMLDIGHTGFPVVNEEGLLVGVVTRRDLSNALHQGKGEMTLSETLSGLQITAFPHEMLHQARDRIFEQDIGRLIVVDPHDRKKVIGILTRSDLLRAEAMGDVEYGDMWRNRGRG